MRSPSTEQPPHFQDWTCNNDFVGNWNQQQSTVPFLKAKHSYLVYWKQSDEKSHCLSSQIKSVVPTKIWKPFGIPISKSTDERILKSQHTAGYSSRVQNSDIGSTEIRWQNGRNTRRLKHTTELYIGFSDFFGSIFVQNKSSSLFFSRKKTLYMGYREQTRRTTLTNSRKPSPKFLLHECEPSPMVDYCYCYKLRHYCPSTIARNEAKINCKRWLYSSRTNPTIYTADGW